jgi:hypothetical protein
VEYVVYVEDCNPLNVFCTPVRTVHVLRCEEVGGYDGTGNMVAVLCNCRLSVQPMEVVEAVPVDGKSAPELDFGKN